MRRRVCTLCRAAWLLTVELRTRSTPSGTGCPLAVALCADASYTKMRLARMALASPGDTAGADTAEFKKQCAQFASR